MQKLVPNEPELTEDVLFYSRDFNVLFLRVLQGLAATLQAAGRSSDILSLAFHTVFGSCVKSKHKSHVVLWLLASLCFHNQDFSPTFSLQRLQISSQFSWIHSLLRLRVGLQMFCFSIRQTTFYLDKRNASQSIFLAKKTTEYII